MKNHTQKFISILLALAMLMSLIPMNLSVSAAPDTDYTGYYKITNAGNLAWFACLVVGDTSQSGITEAEPDAKAVLTADIDITVLGERLGKSWVGIGTEEIPFTGIFDGNGYTIKGLTTDTSLTKSSVATVAVGSEKQGLFGVIGEGGVVRDVIVEGTANLSDTIKYGGICSENNGTIENVLSMITITGGDNADVFCHTNNGTITNSFANQTTSVASGVTTVDAAALADGSVTYALGDSFGQTIGTDLQPVHYDGTNRVYQVGDTYTNTEPVYVVSVTDKDGKLIGNYTTFADAITAAENSAGSTLTLLDNTEGVYAHIVSPVTLDLNGYTLDMGDDNIFVGSVLTGYDPHVTLTDTSEAGTGKIKGSAFYGVFNAGYNESPGKLTVQGGTIEYTGTQGAIAIRRNGTLEMSGGSIKSTASTISINNYLEDFGGSIDISGGSFPDGLKIQVNSTEYTSTEQYLTDLLAEGCYFYNENYEKITVADDATEITGYVQVKEYFAASVTDKDGKLVGKYKTLAEAVTAASESEDSTLTLLDDITLTATQYINSGKLTLDLNGKTLLNETGNTLLVKSGADITVKDSGEGGTIKTTGASSSAVLSWGTLTVESGHIIGGDKAVDSDGTALTINGGTFEGKKYSVYIGNGTSEIYGGEFNGNVWGFAPYTINDGDFTSGYIGINCEGGVLTVNGGKFDIDEIKVFKGTVSLEGGEFTNGFTVYDAKMDSDAEQFAATILADGYFYRNENGDIIEVEDDTTVINGYVKITKGADLETEATVTLSGTEFDFTGKEIRPEVTVTVGNTALADSSSLEISYTNNVNAGTAVVTVTGVEDSGFTGTVTREFTISPMAVDIVWSETTEFEHDGNPHSVTAYYVDADGNHIDAVVENGTNTEVGKYTATATVQDTNYVVNEDTTTLNYVIKGDVTVGGTVTSFLSETDEVMLVLTNLADTEDVRTQVVTGNSAEFAFDGIGEGTYTLTVSKNNHVTRTYDVVVDNEQVSMNVKIHLKGDINGDGKVNTIDTARANSHAKGVTALTGYELLCADVSGDGKVNTIDVSRINSHAKGITVLW